MGDIICKVCGEPWDYWGVMLAIRGREDEADMTKEEAEMLLSGKGCPACKGKPRDNKDHSEEYYSSLVEADGEINVLDYLF